MRKSISFFKQLLSGVDDDTGLETRLKAGLVYYSFAICIGVLIYSLFTFVAFFQQIELNAMDLRFRMRPAYSMRMDDRLGTVDINESLIDRAGSWPVKRTFYADMMRVLDRYGTEQFLFDIFFPNPGINSRDDADLQKALAETDVTILAQTFKRATKPHFKDLESIEKATQGGLEMMNQMHRRSLAMADKFSLPYDIKQGNRWTIEKAYVVEPPVPEFLEGASGLGFAQTIQDIDGTVRKYPLFFYFNGRLYPSLVVMSVLRMHGLDPQDIEIVPGSHVSFPGTDIRIPVDKQLKMNVNWAGDYVETFHHYPATALLSFEAVDLMKKRLREAGDTVEAVVGKGIDHIIEEVARRRLEKNEISEERVMALLVARLAEIRILAGGDTRERFIADMGGADDSETAKLAGDIWQQVHDNNKRVGPDGKFRGLDAEGLRPLYFFEPETIKLQGLDRVMTLSPWDLKGKFLFLGLTATATHDFNPMPFVSRYPMVGLHVNALNTVLTGLHIRQTSLLQDFLIVLGLPILVVIMTPRHRPLAGAILQFLLFGAYLFANINAFNVWGWRLPMIAPLLSLVMTYLAIVIYRFVLEQREKRKIRSVFSTYMSASVVEQVLNNPEMLKLGGQRKNMTVFFCDVAGFTSISEQLSSEELVSLLNEFLEDMTNIIFKHRGTLDKYEGDAIMAFWNAPMDLSGHEYLACCAALDCIKHLRDVLHPRWERSGRPLLDMRIGINSGEMIVGNMGSKTRMDYTVMGDAVNLGARLESANKFYGTKIMISESTMSKVKDRMVCRELDAIRVKGRTHPERVYEIIGRNSDVADDERKKIELFSDGLKFYQNREWDKGIESFKQVLSVDPDDGPAKTYMERCDFYNEKPPPDDWDGVWTMREK
ncbi:hypothetical protein BVX97_05510 [bacterium E08(2017)]|nr:hypothetical protein BVX97_05510 [bacterium E08(2017)]